MGRLGYVYYKDKYAGYIQELDIGYNFTYDSAYIITGTPIGFNFPFTQILYFSAVFFPYFQNLISEGWLLGLQTTIQHLDKSDSFGLLLHNGKDLPGAVTIMEEHV